MKTKYNFFYLAGMLIFAVTLLCKNIFAGYPHFLHGLFIGLSLVFILMGTKYSSKWFSKLRALKLNILNSIIRK